MEKQIQVKIIKEFLDLFNKAKFESLTTAEMITHTRKLEAVARLINFLEKPETVEPKKEKRPKFIKKGNK